jgi:sarcosine oxidase
VNIFYLSCNDEAILEAAGGYLRSDELIKTNLKLAQQYGASIVLNNQVVKVENKKLTLKNSETISADKIILTAGAFMADLVPEIKNRLKPTRQYIAWFKINKNYELHKVFHSPTFVWPAAADRLFYGFPAIDGPEGGFKIGVENTMSDSPAVDPHKHQPDVTPDEVRKAYGDITWICSACSGRGFKFSHGIGVMMTDLIKNDASPLWSKNFQLCKYF